MWLEADANDFDMERPNQKCSLADGFYDDNFDPWTGLHGIGVEHHG